MAENKQYGIDVFDTLFTNNHICMMKLMLPLLPSSLHKSIAIYIKYLELQYTLQYFSRHPLGLAGTTSSNIAGGTDTVMDSMLPYCTPKERQNLTQIRNMMQTLQNMKDMMEMLETMKELFPEGFATGDGNISPEILSAFDSGISPEIFSAFTQNNVTPDIFAAFAKGDASSQTSPSRE